MDVEIDSQLISIQIDKSLTWIWDQLSLTPEERKEKKKILLKHLSQSYCEFVKAEYFELDKVNQDLIKAKDNFRKVKDRLGDLKTFIPSHIEKLSLFEQIAFIEKLTYQLLKDNSSQIQESKKQYRSLSNLYDELGIPDNQRGEFSRDNDTDYSSSRLIRINNQIHELQKEKTRRVELANQLSSSIRNMSNVTQEPINQSVQMISDNKDISVQAINELEETNFSLMDLSKSRADQVRYYIRQIKELYLLLDIDKSKWITFSYTPSASNIEVLEKELESLDRQKEEQLPLIISMQEKEVARLSDLLQLSRFKRPKYYGDDKVEAVKFYKDAIAKLETQVSQSGLSQISLLENIESPGKPRFSRSSNLSNFKSNESQKFNSNSIINDQTQSTTVVGNQDHSTSIIRGPNISTSTSKPQQNLATSSGQRLTSTLFDHKSNAYDSKSTVYDYKSTVYDHKSKTPTKTTSYPHQEVLEDQLTTPIQSTSLISPTKMSNQERHKIYLMSRDPFYL